MLVQDLFVAAMEVIGATSLDEVPEPSELMKCLRHCNLMLNSWSGRRLMVAMTIQENFPLVQSKRAYTIGTGGDFNTPKPITIDTAFVRDASLVDYPVLVIEKDIYDSLSDKMLTTARPDALYYDPGASQQVNQLGTLYFYGIPDNIYTIFLNSQKYLTEFVNLGDTVTFQPIYYEAIVQNLAVKIWRVMGRKGPVPGEIIKAANDAMRVVENINHDMPVARIDVPGASAPSNNIMSGDWMT